MHDAVNSLSISPFRAVRPARFRHARAFSLPELMVVLAITAALAVPACQFSLQWSLRWRTRAAVNALMTAIAYARAESVRRGMPVTVCRSNAQGFCSREVQRCDDQRALPAASAALNDARDWRCGWSVIAGNRESVRAGRMTGRGSAAAVPTPGLILRRFRMDPRVSIRPSGNLLALTFRPPTGQAGGSAGHFGIVSARAGKKGVHQCLRVGMNGRTRLESQAC